MSNPRLDFTNKILRQIDIHVECDDPKVILKTVEDFRHEHKLYLSQCTPRVDDGFLYINDMPVARIASKLQRIPFDEKSYYIEGLILSRQEIVD